MCQLVNFVKFVPSKTCRFSKRSERWLMKCPNLLKSSITDRSILNYYHIHQYLSNSERCNTKETKSKRMSRYHSQLPSEFLLGPLVIDQQDVSLPLMGQLSAVELVNSTNSSTTTTSAIYGDYNTVVISLTSPFVLIFGGLFIASVVSYLMQQKNMKRNQHILFAILFVLESLVFVNMLTRISSELALLHMVPNEGKVASVVIKIFDRCFVNIAIYVEVVLMAHICYIL